MAFKLPGFGGKKINIKESMQKKHGTGEYSRGGKKFEERMKPGESKYQYDVRMRGQERRTHTAKTTKPTSKYHTPDPSAEVSTSGPSYDFQTQERNPGDLREQSQVNYTRLPSAPGDMFEYDFDEEGNISYIDRSKGEDAKWQSPELGSAGDKAIRKRYTGSETGDLSNWYGYNTSGWASSHDVDPVSDEMIDESWSYTDINKKSYLPYDLAQKHYNPKYKGSKK